ncbi:hypothetical protein ACJQWK_02827 [Exserohilum turcicum]
MYIIDEELDRRRNLDGMNVGVWPAARVRVAERMIAKLEKDDPKDDVNDAVEGGSGIQVKGFDQFHREWDTKFRQPMGYFCEWIDLLLTGRVKRLTGNDAPMRCLQHSVVDLVENLDRKHAYIPKTGESLKCRKSTVYCDCTDCRGNKDWNKAYRFRQTSRLNDAGLWPVVALNFDRREGYQSAWDDETSFAKAKEMTYTINLA